MQLTWLRSSWDALQRWEKTAVVVWATILLVVSVRAFLTPDKRTVYPIFSGSARLWWSATDLYEPYRPDYVQGGYRYSPMFALLFTPLAQLPDSAGGVLWRLFSAGALLGALAWLARGVLPNPLTPNQCAWLTLLCLPLTVQSLSNGQANLLVAASMLATVAAVKEQRWNLACAFMTLAFVCKVYPLALGLVLIVLYPRQLLWRMPLALVLSLLAPFLLQHPDYVLDQYQKWIALLRADDRTGWGIQDKHRDLWLLVEIYGIPLSRRWYTLVQMAGGAGVAALCWHRQRRGWTEKALLTSTLALAIAWMMVLGPVVESSTFVLLAPSFALSVLGELVARGWTWRKLLLAASALLFAVAVLSGGVANTAYLNLVGIHSWASLLYFVYLLTEPALPAEQSPPQFMPWRAAA